jgi:hypothetical protein
LQWLAVPLLHRYAVSALSLLYYPGCIALAVTPISHHIPQAGFFLWMPIFFAAAVKT